MRALIIVDLQNDFVPGGALAVKRGDEIIPVINQLLHHPFDLKIATKDWHPQGHVSFATGHGKAVGEKIIVSHLEQVLWPEHCIKNTPGADYAEGLDFSQFDRTIYKGSLPDVDSYSTFFDNRGESGTGLDEYLKANEIDEVYIAGLATDYCVKFSVLDAIALGYKTYVIQDACRGVDLVPGDSKKATQEMIEKGAILISSNEILDS